jgi:RNA polymerase sigma-70 factor (ECF subfamily)
MGMASTRRDDTLDAALLSAAAGGNETAFAGLVEPYRRELHAHCYRMLGSVYDAEDALQDALLRAWRGLSGFQGRSSLRSWLYTIATNVCLDMPQRPQRRARPMDLVTPSTADITTVPDALPHYTWVQPVPDGQVLSGDGDPAELASLRESIRLAFVAALQHLPARQRAVLILREVLHWQASEVAELLGTTSASVNSALQRARATLDAAAGEDGRATLDSALAPEESGRALDADEQELVAKYTAALESYDIDSLVSLLREDASFSMPPHPLWIRGPHEVRRWLLGPGIGCKGSRVLVTRANGGPAVAAYRIDPNGGHSPWTLQVIEISRGRISGIHNYLNTELFELFGLPAHLDD